MTSIKNLVNERLQALKSSPVVEMQRQPEKRNLEGHVVKASHLFSKKDIEISRFVFASDDARKQLRLLENGAEIALENTPPGRAPYENYDRADHLVDNFQYSSPETIEAAGLQQSKLDESPWSDDYWPLYKGILGCRYADPDFPNSTDWSANFTYVVNNKPEDIIATDNVEQINLLSPAEKYDLLVGDKSGTLTRKMWEQGRQYHDSQGTVETWMGICHGWAPAAYMLSRPRNTVEVIAVNGMLLRFYPSDIKALASLLWAQVPTFTKFIGGRCNDQNPDRDPINGRLISSQCFDTNPGTWHLSLVNQIGVSRRSMILDATYDYEVWNQPINGYKFWYFNPQEMKWADSFAEAKVNLNAFTNDMFKDYRSAGIASVVGIMNRVQYVVETSPSHSENDSPSADAINTVDYYYDLELDHHGDIIGGEWYQNKHPDFLWTPPPEAKARTHSENFATGIWSSTTSIPKSWRSAAWYASYNNAAPLAKIVNHLIKLANI